MHFLHSVTSEQPLKISDINSFTLTAEFKMKDIQDAKFLDMYYMSVKVTQVAGSR